MINERLKKRLKKDRPSTTITMRIPADVVESLKTVAPTRSHLAANLAEEISQKFMSKWG